MSHTYLFKGSDRLDRKRKGQIVAVDRESAKAKLYRAHSILENHPYHRE